MIRRELGYIPNNGKCQAVGCTNTIPCVNNSTKNKHKWHICYDAYDKAKDVLLCPDCYLKANIKKES